MEVLSESVALDRNANLAEISLRRKSGQTLKLDLYKAIMRGDASQDVVLDGGDAIFIPLITKDANRVYILGEVDKWKDIEDRTLSSIYN